MFFSSLVGLHTALILYLGGIPPQMTLYIYAWLKNAPCCSLPTARLALSTRLWRRQRGALPASPHRTSSTPKGPFLLAHSHSTFEVPFLPADRAPLPIAPGPLPAGLHSHAELPVPQLLSVLTAFKILLSHIGEYHVFSDGLPPSRLGRGAVAGCDDQCRRAVWRSGAWCLSVLWPPARSCGHCSACGSP